MNDQKIKAIRKEITDEILKDFNFKMNDVISLCESQIEELLFLHLYNYFKNYKEYDWMKEFNEPEFIDDWIHYYDSAYDEEDRKHLENIIKKKNYRFTSGGFYQKYIGFKTRKTTGEKYYSQEERKKLRLDDYAFQEFEIYPQYEVNIDGKQFRIDIAIILNRINDNKIIESRKVALECDGYDYHSSPEQKKNDDIRTRKLKKNGWKEVLRYSGRELFELKTKKEVHEIFEEIVDILYI